MTDAQRGHPVLAEVFRHNLWANLILLDLCATLPDEVLDTNVPGTYGNIRETLPHLVGAEERYLAALIAGPERRNPTLEQTAPDLATLREHARQSGERFITYAGTVEGNPTLQVTWRGESAVNHMRCRPRSSWCRPSTTPPNTAPRSRPH
jgi:uncharacterized damage-inducible protein DinB